MAKYSLEEAFEILKKKADWEPPEHYSTVRKFIHGIFEDVHDNTLSSSGNYLIYVYSQILHENKRGDWDE